MPHSNPETFDAWLKSRRRELGLTQKELAQHVRCAEITIRKIEADKLRPSRRSTQLRLQELEALPAQRANLVRFAWRSDWSK